MDGKGNSKKAYERSIQGIHRIIVLHHPQASKYQVANKRPGPLGLLLKEDTCSVWESVSCWQSL